eukprot:Skav214543  [mRNA]  locus=scaffold410:634586:635420:+ [translate_table: standard]
MLQLQFDMSRWSNSSWPNNKGPEGDVLMDALMQQEAVVSRSWTALADLARHHGYTVELQLPLWALICALVLMGAMGFYVANYMLWVRRGRAQRLHDLEDVKKHSEHGNMLGSLVEAGHGWAWGCQPVLVLFYSKVHHEPIKRAKSFPWCTPGLFPVVRKFIMRERQMIMAAIEHFDQQLIGVNVDFGAMKVTVSGFVNEDHATCVAS